MWKSNRSVDLGGRGESAHVKGSGANVVFFEGFGKSALNFELVVWSSEMSHRPRRYRSDLNFAIERKLREAGIEIPFPQRDLHIRSGVLKTENVYSDEEESGDRAQNSLRRKP